MKKIGVIVLLSLLLVSSFVSAQATFAQNVESLANGFAKAVSPVARLLLGSDSDFILSDEQLFIKVLVFLLVFIFAAAAAKNIPLLQERPASAFLVGAILAVGGVRFITSDELINTLWLPSSTFAVALTSIVPFAVFFYLIEGFDSSVLRKFGWTTYFVIFAYFSISRWSELRITSPDTVFNGFSAAWIYVIIAGVSGFLIFNDRKIHGYFRYQGIKKISDRGKRVQAIKLAEEIDGLYETLAKTSNAADRTLVEQQIAAKEATLKTMYH